jgi:serine/threonine protein kinase
MNIGERVGDYEIVEVLGQGGMGQVYKVKNVLSERIEAMKVLLPNMEGDSDLAERFLREIKVQAAFDHPNIAKLYTALRASNQLLMVMEFVEGTSMEKLLAKGPLLVGETVDYASQVLDALAYAHGRGVVHRDIKPANMMRTPAGKVKLLDFGIAHMANSSLTQVGTTVGSLFYMSPEQVKGGPADPRSDLYSLGVVLYEMVTGKRPFLGDSASAIMTAHLQQTPVAPNDMVPWVLGPLNEIILMAVAKDPDARFQSAAAFRNALQSVAAKETDQAKTQIMGSTTAALPVAQPSLPQPTTQSPKQLPLQPSVVQPSLVQPSTQPRPVPSGTMPQPVAGQSAMVQSATVQSVPQSLERPSSTPASAPPVDSSSLPDFAGQPHPPQAGNRRGLYMALGSIVTLAVLIAAAIEGPKFLRTHAAGNPPKTTVQDSVPPASQPTPVQTAPVPAQTTPVPAQTTTGAEPAASQSTGQTATAGSSTSPAATVAQDRRSLNGQAAAAGRGPASQSGSQPATGPQPQQASQARNQQISAVRQEYNSLAINVNSAKESLRSIKEQMASQGLGLRSDVREAETRMTYLLGEAKDKLKNGDAEGAKHDLEMAQLALDQVEKFLGH